MQEEVESRTLTLAINSGKMSGRILKEAVGKYLAHRAAKKNGRNSPVRHRGRQSVRQLVGQGQAISNVELTGPSLREFDRIARKYGMDYAIRKDSGGPKTRFLVFFKAQDSGALHAALEEYARKTTRQKGRPSVLKKLAQFQANRRERTPEPPRQIKEKEREREQGR